MDGHGGDHGHGHDGHSHGGFGHDKGFAHSVFDLNFGHGHHAGATTFDAIVVGHAFGDFGMHSPHIDSHVCGHSDFHAAPGTMDGNGPSFEGPIDLNRTNMAILVVGLGLIDWETAIRNKLIALGTAECFNLQPPNPIVSPARRYDELLPVNFKAPTLKVPNPEMPKGFYPGASGSTEIWRTNWQLGQRSWLEAKLGRPAVRVTGVRTYLEVEVTEWSYVEAGDYELRLIVRVIGGKDPSELRDHLKVARELCQAMLKTLKNASPSDSARVWREQQVAARG